VLEECHPPSSSSTPTAAAKDGGVLLYNTNNNSMTRTPPAELNGQMVQPATEAFPAKSSQKSLRYNFSKYKDKKIG
jgi:hypothetical protein